MTAGLIIIFGSITGVFIIAAVISHIYNSSLLTTFVVLSLIFFVLFGAIGIAGMITLIRRDSNYNQYYEQYLDLSFKLNNIEQFDSEHKLKIYYKISKYNDEISSYKKYKNNKFVGFFYYDKIAELPLINIDDKITTDG